MRIRSPKELGGFLKDTRYKAGLSQTELASRLNASQKWISGVENGMSAIAKRSRACARIYMTRYWKWSAGGMTSHGSKHATPISNAN